MAQTTLSVRMDDNLKRQFDAICSEMGMNTTTAIMIYAKAIVRQRKIPFEVTADDPFFSAANTAWLQTSINDLNAGRSHEHDIIEVADD